MKGGGTEKRGEGKQSFEKWGQAGASGGCLKKKKGLQSPYELWTKEIIDLLTTNIPHHVKTSQLICTAN